jgi:hypothetical protein
MLRKASVLDRAILLAGLLGATPAAWAAQIARVTLPPSETAQG